MGACCSGIGTSQSPEETAVKIRARNNFRDKYTRENEEHQKQKRIDEQGEVWQQQREEAARVRRLREAGQQNRNKQRQERDRTLQEEQKKEEDRRNRKDVKRYDKAQQMPDDSYGGSQAPYKYQAKQHNVQNTGRPVRIDGRMEEDDQTAVLTEQRQNVKGKQSGGGIHVIPPDVGKEELKDDRPQRSKRPRKPEVVEVSGVQRVQEIEKAKMKKDEKTIHSEAQRQQQESDQEISESGHEVAKVKIHPSDVDPIIRERALTSQY
uniref:Uncharacterized protein n=1 Tax=Magallana gigas TaxID=29159 RepID=A0A8W8LZM1_MAGGI